MPPPPTPEGASASADVVVVGGGPTGLTAALLAARAGRSVHLVEAAPRLGGMAASIEVGGQRVDLGSHRLHPSAPAPVRQLLEELLGPDLQVRQRHGRLRLADRWVAFPLRTLDLVRSVPPAMAARIAVDLATAHRRAEQPDDTYADVVRARLGPTVLQHFHGPYGRKLWGTDLDQLAGDLARRRIALRGGGDVLARLRRSATPAGRTFLYPRLGYGQVVDRLADAAVNAGVKMTTDCRPQVVQPDRTAPAMVLSDGRRLTAGRILWTVPPDALAAAVDRPWPDVVAHRAVVLVYLVLDQPRWLEWDAHYVPDPAVPFVRLSEPKNYRDGPDPADRTVLCAEVPCDVGDVTWTAATTTLADHVLAGIGRLGLPVPRPIEVEAVRLPRVYPRFAGDDVPALRAAQADIEALAGVTVLGRPGLVVADNLHHVMAMGMAAVDCLAPAGWDDAAWARARADFDRFVVED